MCLGYKGDRTRTRGRASRGSCAETLFLKGEQGKPESHANQRRCVYYLSLVASVETRSALEGMMKVYGSLRMNHAEVGILVRVMSGVMLLQHNTFVHMCDILRPVLRYA
jgi:hypothetical protein